MTLFLWKAVETHGSVRRPFPVLLLRSAAVVPTMVEHEKTTPPEAPHLSSSSNEPSEDVAETPVVHGAKSATNSSSVKEKISPIAVPYVHTVEFEVKDCTIDSANGAQPVYR
jgi:hypothetical protein